VKEIYRDTGLVTGFHAGSTGAALYDSTKDFEVLYSIGRLVENDTDGSSGLITAHTTDTVTVTLTGGTNNFWTHGDAYTIYVGATANAKLSSTEVCRLSGFATPRDLLVDGVLPEFDDIDDYVMDTKE
jgi:hypothetical protein